jgi:hypothetical protein
MKEKLLPPLNELLTRLRKSKVNWLSTTEQLKQRIVESKENVKEWQLRLKGINQELDAIKEKKRRVMHSSGLKRDEEMPIENMPSALQKIERALIDKATKKQKIANICEENTKNSAKIEGKCKARLKGIIESIEQDEYMRVSVIRQSLILSAEMHAQVFNNKLLLLDTLLKACMNVNPMKDIQAFITKSSFYTSNEEELKEVYKSVGDSCYAEEMEREFKQKRNQEASDNKNKEVFLLKCFQSRASKQQVIYNTHKTSVPFIMSPSTAAFSHTKSVSTGTSCDSISVYLP